MPALVENLRRLAGSAAGDEGAGFEQLVQRADASRRFDLDVRRRVLAHQLQVGERRAAGAVTGRGFDPVAIQLAADFAEPNLVRVLQVAILEDDFDLLPGRVRGVGDFLDLFPHVVPLAAEYLADVDNHVEFLAAVFERL